MSEKNKSKSNINLSRLAEPKIKEIQEAGDLNEHNITGSQNFVQNKRITAVALSLITCFLICVIGFQVTHTASSTDVALYDKIDKKDYELQRYLKEKIDLQEKIAQSEIALENQEKHIGALNHKLDKTIERLNAAHQEKRREIAVQAAEQPKPLRKISISKKVRELRSKLMDAYAELEAMQQANNIANLKVQYLQDRLNESEQDIYTKDNANHVQLARIISLESEVNSLKVALQAKEREFSNLVESNRNIKGNLKIALTEIEREDLKVEEVAEQPSLFQPVLDIVHQTIKEDVNLGKTE